MIRLIYCLYLPYQILSIVGTILTFITIIYKDLVEDFVRNNMILSAIILFLIICIFIAVIIFFKWLKNKLRAKAAIYFGKALEYRHFDPKDKEDKETHFKNLELYLKVFYKYHIKPDNTDIKKVVGINVIKNFHAYRFEYDDAYNRFLKTFERFIAYCEAIGFYDKVRIAELEKKNKEDKRERTFRAMRGQNALDCL